MIDENAFGLLIAYLSIEDDEYDGEREDFVARYQAFWDLVYGRLREQPPGDSARAIVLGHALYLELIEGNGECDLIAWLRATRTQLGELSYLTAGVLTYGSSWYQPDRPCPHVSNLGTIKLVNASGPSEALRRALHAEAATRGGENDDALGWGPGLYLDVDAIEALGRKPKNQPTILRSGGAEFYRVGS